MKRNEKDNSFRAVKEYVVPSSIVNAITLIAVIWAVAFVLKSYFYSQIEKEKLATASEIEKEKIRLNSTSNSTIMMDKLTFCIQTVMEASTKAGKNIDAKQAKEICKDVKTN